MNSGIDQSYESLFLNILQNLTTFFHNDYSKLRSYQYCTKVPFCPHPYHHLSFVFLLKKTKLEFHVRKSNVSEMIYHHGFNLPFPDE
jgi:hypothetical protein